MHVRRISLHDEQLRDRLQTHINAVQADVNAHWDGEIYCVKHSSTPYDLILKMWHELEVMDSSTGQRKTLKYYSFYLAHKAYVLDGEFRSLKLQNSVGRHSVLCAYTLIFVHSEIYVHFYAFF